MAASNWKFIQLYTEYGKDNIAFFLFLIQLQVKYIDSISPFKLVNKCWLSLPTTSSSKKGKGNAFSSRTWVILWYRMIGYIQCRLSNPLAHYKWYGIHLLSTASGLFTKLNSIPPSLSLPVSCFFFHHDFQILCSFPKPMSLCNLSPLTLSLFSSLQLSFSSSPPTNSHLFSPSPYFSIFSF